MEIAFELMKNVFTESGFLALLILFFVIGIGFWFSRITKAMIGLLDKSLSSFLENFKNLVNSITDLTEAEKVSAAKNSEEHHSLLRVLEKILDKLDK